jgi:hypothetical protein
MHPIAALMLSQAMEEERRRVIARRPHRFLEPFTEERTDSRRWLIHFAKLNLSGSKA